MSMARKFKRQAARNAPKPAPEEETSAEIEAPKPVQPEPFNRYNPTQRPGINSAPIVRPQARRGTQRGK